jgi:precorrin-6Y C5,15-methyltransferase (decarboxylating)
MTKQEVRSITVAKLKPVRDALLWDVGCGCGTVAIEWMRAATNARAIGIDSRLDRCELSSINALNLGVPDLKVVHGKAPESLHELAQPDAIFIGGGFTKETFEICLLELKLLGRLVVNAVTLESEVLLLDLYKVHGGELAKISINRVESIGSSAVWKPFKPITQWSLQKK